MTVCLAAGDGNSKCHRVGEQDNLPEHGAGWLGVGGARDPSREED